jgi:(4S)-4-hydroxy-5-phosphonooxypentane-2,3-dione isomerase
MRFALTVRFTLHPGRLGDFLPRMQDNARQSLAGESGCLAFDVALPLDGAADEVFLWEIYCDRAAFDVHLASAHFRAFDAATSDMVAAKALHFYQVP